MVETMTFGQMATDKSLYPDIVKLTKSLLVLF